MSDYNGWSNRETWLVNLWMDNNGAEYYKMIALDCLKEQLENAEYDVANASRLARGPCGNAFEYVHESESYEFCENKGVFRDLLSTALANVNWYELAKAWLEEVAEEYIQELINNA